MARRRDGGGTALAAALLPVLLAAAGCGTDGGSRAAPPAGPSDQAHQQSRGASSPQVSPPAAGPYVALGDSYTSGLKVPPQSGTPAGCARSGANYPALVATGLGLTGAGFRDVSCSGARTGDLTAPQRTADGTNPPQLDALTGTTRLVTVGIGGNDAGFMDVITRCARESLRSTLAAGGADTATGGAPSACRAVYTAAGGGPDEVQQQVAAAGGKVGGVLAEIHRRAPSARVYVVGYPALLPADPAACRETLGDGFAAADLAFLTEKQQQLNGMLRERAAAAGAVFVDTAAASAGHDMCAGEAERWIEPALPAAGAAPLHPNARGERGMAQAVLAAVRG
ncbi:SGNH/GDSL hydrolase family protein [Kitasatospora sp. DSM 101779]|uniref:SGNH/GDSL hydrolase family protein n=1 Tax=Kitasatospora sp. DSM 101779 TaxID=2853165 RepID=UPI0021D8C6D5|nr:SGNH/GDSL hydrolase family protein [Kitasatospora sp. DSM 101779]MCU7824913.1 SGNH/GDSL hydrolase family protein [Kitasatospora sp. DSM 101779]